MPMTFGEWKKNKERMEAGQAAPSYASPNVFSSGGGKPQSAVPHAYAGHGAEWNALRADAEQLGMASAYGLPTDQYYRYRGGKPYWMMEADAEDYKRLLAENPPVSQAGSAVPGTGAGELQKLEAGLKAMGNGTYPPFAIGEEVPKSTRPQPYAGYTDEWNDLRANAAQLGMVSADGTPTDRYYQRMGGKPYWMIEADYADYLRRMAENPPFQKKSSYDVTSDPLYIAYMQSGNDFRYGAGLPSLQSVDFASDWMSPLASGNGSGIMETKGTGGGYGSGTEEENSTAPGAFERRIIHPADRTGNRNRPWDHIPFVTGESSPGQSVPGTVPDYTKEIDERLAEAVAGFESRSVGDGGPSSIGRLLSNFDNYRWFYDQVDHKGPWDIKVDEPWRQQFPNLEIPKKKFIYRGEMVERADLGNFAYGYLGTAMGVHSDFLYQMGGAAALTEGKPPNFGTILNAYGKALEAGAENRYGDPEEDHEWIKRGIDAYNAWKGKAQ